MLQCEGRKEGYYSVKERRREGKREGRKKGRKEECYSVQEGRKDITE